MGGRLTTYTVHETFHTFQGEGDHMGRPAFFIRLQGCDQACAWCDAAGTWHPDHKPRDLMKSSADNLADLADQCPRGSMVVITGGEPCLYDLDPLISALYARGREVHIETAGHQPVPRRRGLWITLSPKPDGIPPREDSVLFASEYKIIVSDQRTLDAGLELIRNRPSGPSVWLHPEWGHRTDPVVLRAIVDAVKADDSGELRAGWQVHKLYRADLLDPGARTEPVPLGGVDGAPY